MPSSVCVPLATQITRTTISARQLLLSPCTSNPCAFTCRAQLPAVAGIFNLCYKSQGGDMVLRTLRYALRKVIVASSKQDTGNESGELSR